MLDLRLAKAFSNAGGVLRSGTRMPVDSTVSGRVTAAGRRREPSRWIGLKAHVEDLPLGADLELHLGEGAYVGACDVAEGRTNVCGLFRARPELNIGKSVTPLETYLRACGLEELAGRIAAAHLDAESHCAVAALSFTRPSPHDPRMLVGDAYAMIPPFTGNGMAMALQSAAMAVDPLMEWSLGRIEWTTAVGKVRRRLRWRFGLRLFMAGLLHRFIHGSSAQTFFSAFNRAGLVPLRPLYHALH